MAVPFLRCGVMVGKILEILQHQAGLPHVWWKSLEFFFAVLESP